MSTEQNHPLVSVVIPCYNQDEYLQAALASVLAQSFTDWEAVVVNDGSTDDTVETAEAFFAKFPDRRWRLVSQENSGLAAARNAGVRTARGEFILPLDADDLLHPLYLERTVPILRNNPGLGYVYVVVDCFGDEHRTWTGGHFDFNKLLEENLMACTTLFRKRAWEDAGGYNTNMIHGFEDWDLWVGMGERGWFGQLLPEPLFLYRKHGQTMLQNAYDKHDEWSRARLVMNHPSLYPPARVEEARKIINLGEESMQDEKGTKNPAILFFHYEKPLNPEGVNAGAEMALIHMARALVKKGCRVSVAGYLTGAPGVHQGVRFIDMGVNYDYAKVLAAEAAKHQVVISSARADVLEEAAKYEKLKLKILWLHVDSLSVVRRSAGQIEALCDGVICVSQAHGEMMMRQGLNGSSVHVVHNGADVELFKPLPEVTRESRRVVYAGALVPLKGVHNLYAAFQTVRKKFPDAALHIFGSADMWGESEYIDISANDPKLTGVHFRGKVPQAELAEEFCRASLLVVPSLLDRPEPYPLTPLDAQACECPVLVTPSGGLPEGLEDGITGRVLPDDSVESLADYMMEMLSDPERLRQMGKAARERILQGHTWIAAAEKMLSLIESLERGKEFHLQTEVIGKGRPIHNPSESNQSRDETKDFPVETASNRNRIGMVTTFNQKCGLATYARYLFEHYNEKNTVILAEDSNGDRTAPDGPNVFRCWRRDDKDYSRFERTVRDNGINILHINYQMAFFLNPLFYEMLNRLRGDGVKVVASLHATDGFYNGYIWLDNASDAILVHMEENRTQWAAVGCNQDKVHIIPHGMPEFPPVEREKVRKNLQIPPELQLYLSFGFIEPHKGVAENITALGKLKGRFPFLYVIMGDAHPRNPVGIGYIESCRKLVKELNMEEEVQFMIGYNPFEQLWIMMNAADAIFMNYQSNRYESSGAAALALSSPAPVITSNAPPFADLQGAVLRITENNSLDLNLIQLREIESLRQFLRRQREELLRQRSWKKTAEKIHRIYAGLNGGYERSRN